MDISLFFFHIIMRSETKWAKTLPNLHLRCLFSKMSATGTCPYHICLYFSFASNVALKQYNNNIYSGAAQGVKASIAHRHLGQ
jgi:hypothetical protein